jgi:hypothetical protein
MYAYLYIYGIDSYLRPNVAVVFTQILANT